MFSSPIVIGSLSFERLRDGLYIEAGSTVDTPNQLVIANRNLIGSDGRPLSSGNPAQITVSRKIYKNAAVSGAPDYFLNYWTSWSWVPGQFTQAEIEAVRDQLNTFLTTTGVMTRLHRAEL